MLPGTQPSGFQPLCLASHLRSSGRVLKIICGPRPSPRFLKKINKKNVQAKLLLYTWGWMRPHSSAASFLTSWNSKVENALQLEYSKTSIITQVTEALKQFMLKNQPVQKKCSNTLVPIYVDVSIFCQSNKSSRLIMLFQLWVPPTS